MSSWITLGIALAVIALLAAWRDSIKKTTILFYDLDPSVATAFANAHAAFIGTSKSNRIWHVASKATVIDQKYHAGAGSLIDTREIRLHLTPPPKIKTNIQPLAIPLGERTIYFFPDRLLILDQTGFGAVSYNSLQFELSITRFITTKVPSDATVVGHTWRYTNKDGGPDRRFSYNPQIPIIATSTLNLGSDSGLNGVVMFSSNVGISYFADELRGLVRTLPKV